MTGWGRGVCGCGGAAGFGPDWPARGGRGAGFGWGRVWRNRSWAAGPAGWPRGGWWPEGVAPWAAAADPAEDERQMLEREAAALEQEIGRIRARLDVLAEKESD
jgi:hypothetical protein